MVRHRLKKQNADATLRDGLGTTALDMAAIRTSDNAEIIDLLSKHKKVKIDKHDKS